MEDSLTHDRLAASVIVPAYNASATIGRCLEALARQTVPPDCYEIIVVDDGSTDDTRGTILKHPGVRLLVQAHAGPAAARNLGVQHARGEIVLFTDADCEPAPDWIERMLAPFQVPDGLPEERLVMGVKGAYLTRQRALVARFAQIEYEERYDRLARLETIDFVDTYSAGYRRSLLLAHGGFDTQFRSACVEDQELSFRLASQGYRLVFAPQARVYHWGYPETVADYFARKLHIAFWRVRVLSRYPSKVLADSHTPGSLRAQILAVGVGGLCLVGAAFWPSLAWGAAIAALLFLSTAWPLITRAWHKDRAVGWVSPFLLFVRALALGVGLLAGSVHHLWTRLCDHA